MHTISNLDQIILFLLLLEASFDCLSYNGTEDEEKVKMETAVDVVEGSGESEITG